MAKVSLNCGHAVIEVSHEKERTISEFLAFLVERAIKEREHLPAGIEILIRGPASNFHDVEVEHEPSPQWCVVERVPFSDAYIDDRGYVDFRRRQNP